MRRHAFVVALVLALWGLPAPTASSAQSTAQSAGALAGAQAVLDARVAALKAGDRAGWLATVDPQAGAEFKALQGRLFDGLKSLPLASYSLEARVFDSGDLSTRGPGTFLPETRQRMRLRDYDAVDAVDSLWLTFVERDGRWFVAADADLAGVGLDTARGLWDYGEVVAQPTAHFLLLSHPAQVERARALGALAERAFGVLAQRWTQPWPGKIPLVLPGSIDELRGILQSTVDLTKFVAFVSYSAVRDGGYEPTAPRIYIQDQNLSRHSERFQLETLVHELNHAAVAASPGPFIPAWVHEGVADWVSSGQSTTERNRSGQATVPRDYQFSTGPQRDIVNSYAMSRQAMSTLAAAKGVAAPAAFITELAKVRAAPGSADYQVDAALRRAAALGVADLERLWRR